MNNSNNFDNVLELTLAVLTVTLMVVWLVWVYTGGTNKAKEEIQAFIREDFPDKEIQSIDCRVRDVEEGVWKCIVRPKERPHVKYECESSFCFGISCYRD